MPENKRLTGYRIGDVTLDLVKRRVLRHGRSLSCGRLTFDLLALLACKAPNVVSRDEIVEELWDGRLVSPATIKQRTALLRQALGDRAENPTYVRVFRGAGYALIPEVQQIFSLPRLSARWQRFGLAAGIVLLVFWIGAEVGFRQGRDPGAPSLDGSMSIILASWPMAIDAKADDEAVFANALPKEDYAFVMGMASQVLDVLNDSDFAVRLAEAGGGRNDAGEAALTVFANATGNDSGQINVHFTILNESVSDERTARAYHRSALSRFIRSFIAEAVSSNPVTIARGDDVGQVTSPDGVEVDIRQVSVQDHGARLVRDGPSYDQRYMLTANFVFDRAQIENEPQALQMDVVETIEMAADGELSLPTFSILFRP